MEDVEWQDVDPDTLTGLNETIGLGHSGSPGSAEFLVATHSTAAKMNLQAMPVMVRKSETDGKVALHDSELCLEIGLNVSTQSQISYIGRKSDVGYEMARGIDCKKEQHMIKYQQVNESPVLWPGSTSRASAGINASYLYLQQIGHRAERMLLRMASLLYLKRHHQVTLYGFAVGHRFVIDDKDVDLKEVIEASLPKAPFDTALTCLTYHWLAIEGSFLINIETHLTQC